MITVRDRVEELVDRSPFLRDALGEGLINVSSLARRLHPQVETDLRKPVSIDSVFMALKRHAATLEPTAEVDASVQIGELSLRTDLFQLTVTTSERLLTTFTQAINQSRPTASSFLTFTKTLHEMTITASASMRDTIEEWLQNERITSERDDLTAVSIQRVRGKANPSGAMQYPLQVLAWNGIEVADIISTTNELMIVLDEQDVDRAVGVIRAASKSHATSSKSRRAS